MVDNTVNSGRDGSVAETIFDSISLQVAIAGVFAFIVALSLDIVIGDVTAAPLIAIWGIAATVIGLLVYLIIWMNKPN